MVPLVSTKNLGFLYILLGILRAELKSASDKQQKVDGMCHLENRVVIKDRLLGKSFKITKN